MYDNSCPGMPRGHGKLQRRLLERLRASARPITTVELAHGCGASEVRRVMDELVLEGLVRKVGANLWAAQTSDGRAGAALRRTRNAGRAEQDGPANSS